MYKIFRLPSVVHSKISGDIVARFWLLSLAIIVMIGGQTGQAFADGVSLPSYECNITGGRQACPGPITDTSTYLGVRTDMGLALFPIDISGYKACRYIDNSSNPPGTSLFVPFKSQTEWQDFYSNAPQSNPFLSAVHCSRPYTPATYTVPPPKYNNGQCAGNGSAAVNTPNIYARYYRQNNYATWPASPEQVQFSCYNGATNVNTNVTWDGTDSDQNYKKSWTPVVSYGPDMTLTANPNPITKGQTSTLTWNSSSGSTSCSANWTASHATSGSAGVSPAQTTAYSITCTNGNTGVSSVATITVNVDPQVTVNLTANPNPINSGDSTTLTWSSTGATSCNGQPWTSQTATSGSQLVGPLSNNTNYTMTCSNNADGQGQDSTTVKVNAVPTCGEATTIYVDDAYTNSSPDLCGGGSTPVNVNSYPWGGDKDSNVVSKWQCNVGGPNGTFANCSALICGTHCSFGQKKCEISGRSQQQCNDDFPAPTWKDLGDFNSYAVCEAPSTGWIDFEYYYNTGGTCSGKAPTCGSDLGKTINGFTSAYESPSQLCSNGTLEGGPSINGQGHYWNWNCLGDGITSCWANGSGNVQPQCGDAINGYYTSAGILANGSINSSTCAIGYAPSSDIIQNGDGSISWHCQSFGYPDAICKSQPWQ